MTNREHKRRFAEALGWRVGADNRIVPLVASGDDTRGDSRDDGVHGVPDMERMYEAMTLWDEFMASSIAGYISRNPKPGAGLYGAASTGTERMVVMVGTSHVRGRVGVPDRFTRRTELPTFTVLPVSVRWPALAGRPPPSTTPKLAASEADWVLYTRPQPPNGLALDSYKRLQSDAVFL